MIPFQTVKWLPLKSQSVACKFLDPSRTLFFGHSVDQFSRVFVSGNIRLIEEYLERSGWRPQGRRKFLRGPQPQKLLQEYDESQLYDLFNLQ
jgi:hypothetical protein